MMSHVPTLFSSMNTVTFTVSVLVQAIVLIGLALLADRWLRHRPAQRHAVLLAGLVCVLLCPLATGVARRTQITLVAIPWATSSDTNLVRRETAEIPSREVAADVVHDPPQFIMPPSTTTDTADAPQRAFEKTFAPNMKAVPAARPHAAATTDASSEVQAAVTAGIEANRNPATEPTLPRVVSILSLIWLVGVGFLALRVLLAMRYLQRLKRDARRIEVSRTPALCGIAEQVLRAVPARCVPEVLVSESLSGPVSAGLLRPAIILPEGLIATLSPSQLRDVLIHETAHIYRRDHFVVLLQTAVSALFWPLPLVRLLNTRLDQAREDVCDNYVLSQTEATGYSRTLLEVTVRSASTRAIPLAIGLWECRRKLEQRVATLLDPRRATSTRVPGRRMGALVCTCALILALMAGARVSNAGHDSIVRTDVPDDVRAEESHPQARPDPYDALYALLTTRYGQDGKAYAQDETSPAIFAWSEFPFDDGTFAKFHAALSSFSTLPQDRIDAYSDVKRALLQMHLWKVFDSTFDWNWPDDWYWGGRRSFPKTHMARRTALQPMIASVIRRLALTRDEIHGLPDTIAATIQSGKFARSHDPADRFKPFLPEDIVASESSWVCLGEHRTEIPAGRHTAKNTSRSMFLQFMRLPGGRDATLSFMETLKEQPQEIPAGTQFALMERPFLISDQGELVLSPLTVSVQLRAYLDVRNRFEPSAPTQCVSEFLTQPHELMAGNAVMRAMTPADFRFEAGSQMAAGFSPRDPFAKGEYAGRMPGATRLNQCMNCHGGAGARGVMTRSFRSTNFYFTETSAKNVSEATAAQKRRDDQWKALQKHWQSQTNPALDAERLAVLNKPTVTKKPEPSEQQRTVRQILVDRIETEVVNDLTKLHTAMLRAEVDILAARYGLDDVAVSRLRLAASGAARRAVDKTRKSLQSNIRKNTNYAVDRHDIDMSGIKVHDGFINLKEGPNGPDNKHLRVTLTHASTRTWYSVGLAWISHGDTAGPTDSAVRKDEVWVNALSAALTEEQFKQYQAESSQRFNATVRELVLAALEFELDIQAAQRAAVRDRIREHVRPNPLRSYYIETHSRDFRRKVRAQHLTNILTADQLNRPAEQTEARVREGMVRVMLTALQFDLRLQDAQLPAFRKRLQEKIKSGRLERTIEDSAMRARWKLKAEDFADLLTESQRTLWRFAQSRS